MELSKIQQDGLVEILNIAIGRAASSLSDQLGLEINGAMPQFITGKTADVLDNYGDNEYSQISMLVEVSFDILHKEICGYLVLIIDLPSANDMLSRIDKFIHSVSDK